MAWKLLFVLAVLNNLLIFKINMISAFTHSKVDSLLYLNQPKGFINPKYLNYVLKLNKALYRLK